MYLPTDGKHILKQYACMVLNKIKKHSLLFDKNEKEYIHLHRLTTFCDRLCEIIHLYFVPPFEDVNITEEQYVLLKIIVLFDNSKQFPDVLHV